MKFGEYLRTNLLPEWQDKYIDYGRLKGLINRLEEMQLASVQSGTGIGTSLSVPVPTNAAGMPMKQQEVTQEEFFRVLESEMRKIEDFTHTQVFATCRHVVRLTKCLIRWIPSERCLEM
jgi:SPX domain protein involved in polyphosphate accumulation